MDYGSLPPEINSARIYAGPGSAPLMAAAASWRGLAAELSSAATFYETVIAQLSSVEWLGPASKSMAAAAAPYQEWLRTTGTQAEQTAAQAVAAAASFETAFAATVPPPVIAANRSQLAALVASNVLGQNTGAIAATEAHYGQMWAQDAAAMYSYASSAAAAARVTPFAEPAQATNPAGVTNQAGAVAQAGNTAATGATQTAQLISSLPNAIQGLSSPLSTAASATSQTPWPVELLISFLTNASWNGAAFLLIQPPMAAFNSAATAAAYIPSTLLPSMLGYLSGPGFNALGGGTVGSGLGALLAPGGPLSNLGAMGGGAAAGAANAASAVTGTMGHAATVGALSTPPAWATAIPPNTTASTLQPAGWAAAPESNSVTAMPGGIPGGGTGRGGFGFPRYGFKPTVMPRPVVAG